MNIEISIYIFVALLLSSIRRIISGMKNGCFYAKGNSYPVPKLEKYIKNIHFLETPAWYVQFGSVFLFYFALLRGINHSVHFWGFMIQLLSAYMVTMGSSAVAGYHFQGYINHGSNLPWVDDKENPKSEFAFGSISFWWKRPWKGKFRLYASILGFIAILIGLYLGLFM